MAKKPPVAATRCVYCGRVLNRSAVGGAHENYGRNLTRDHLIPQCLGDGGRGNVVFACQSCNSIKSARTPPEMRVLADLARKQAERWEHLAFRVDQLVDKRGLIAPWREVSE